MKNAYDRAFTSRFQTKKIKHQWKQRVSQVCFQLQGRGFAWQQIIIWLLHVIHAQPDKEQITGNKTGIKPIHIANGICQR